MEKTTPLFSLKNIPIPSKFEYEKKLVQKAESLLDRMRWKISVAKNPEAFQNNYETFGFNTTNKPGQDKDLMRFEEDFLDLISPNNLTYKIINNEFQNNFKQEVRNIKNSDRVTVFADKTRNLYKDTVQSVDAKLMESITKDYKRCDETKVNEINTEAAEIAKSFPTSKDQTLADRIDVLDRNEAFITFKDTKEGFPGRVQTRLINRSKSNIGIISKAILDRINQNLRTKTGLNQWKSSQDVLNWFNNLADKQNYTFLKLDIVSFYPSITEELLLDAINWAKTLTPISNEEIKIIIHSRKSLLFYKKKPWIKKDNPNFDVTQGSNDGAEISELVGLFLLDGLKRFIKKEQQGIYRDDFLAIVKLSGPQVERLRKDLFKFFEAKKLKITIEANITETDFLDISFNLISGIHKPFRKDDNIPTYINKQSNHPTHIKNNLPTMISKRISMLSSNEQVFNQEAYIYNEGLKQSGYNDKIHIHT